ncbi:MAG: DUF1598 domain-containing protein, partial [Planctomycetes bacterium]|nr:DUF1598 domain-containing protein [Planctomycetota bacterium]
QETTGRLDRRRRDERATRQPTVDWSRYSALRKVSLPRLEAALAKMLQDKQAVSDEINYLAGLQRIDYVFVYPDEHDLVIAGPAEGFAAVGGARTAGLTTGQPALRLEDWLVAFRAAARGNLTMRCSIDPQPENLAKFAAFVKEIQGGALPDEAAAQYRQLAEILGPQTVSLSGVPSDSQFAELLVEADIRMKHIAIGLNKPAVKGFRSHLAMVGAGGNSLQRWWFTPLYDALIRSDDGLAFEFRGQRVQLLAEDELVSASGQRSSAPFRRVTTQKFAVQFTEKFPELAKAIPVFAELQGAFDWAVLAALLQKERLSERVDWSSELFLNADRVPLSRHNVPRQVPSVSNYRMLGKGVLVMQVTGGVVVNAWDVVQNEHFAQDSAGKVAASRRSASQSAGAQETRWWWD